MSNVPELYGSMVFNEHVMRERLPKDTFKQLMKTVKEGAPLNIDVANVVAHAMKEWAIEHGATHYTHWFQPLSGITSEKHDGFVDPQPDGRAIMSFSGKELIQGEPDASSFPSGGLRATFEARGYTAWDPTSYAFIKGHTLCVPTAFCSYGGEALDKKTPLLRSMQALNKQALRVLKLFGNEDVKCVRPCVGPEQEYFLVDKGMYEKRKDLVFCGRTLFGAKPPKGQELDDHYFGVIKPRVEAYMEDLNQELWKLGILAKTEHNEVAPAQHELAPIFSVANVATDHNQLTMEIMQKVASRHGLVCLLAEKPFAGVNGSGKHNNWSLATDTGVNLFKPGDTPYENAQFLLFLCGAIQAVDNYQDLLRLSVATAGNDHRLGANEAPPAVISIFLGDELTAVLDAIENDAPYSGTEKTVLKLGVHVLPKFTRDTTDRNRTSPFAFTGNKFEFRMPGSAMNLSDANMILNTAMAKSLKEFADAMEGVPADKFEEEALKYVKKTLSDHKRIIFNGNGYSAEWEEEAARRGLANNKTTADALPCFVADKSIELFEQFNVLSRAEVESRYEVELEKYNKLINIESRTMRRMVRRYYLPAISAYAAKIADHIVSVKTAMPDADVTAQENHLKRMNDGLAKLQTAFDALCAKHLEINDIEDAQEAANANAHELIPLMEAVRYEVDQLEILVPDTDWPVPSYNSILFYV